MSEPRTETPWPGPVPVRPGPTAPADADPAGRPVAGHPTAHVTSRRTRSRGPVVAVCVAVAAASGLGIWLIWAVFVGSTRGQRVERSALRGAAYGQTHLWHVAERVLSVVSVGFIAAVLVAAMLIAVLRRRWSLAVQVAVLMAGANLTTHVLKYDVFDRPHLGIPSPSVNTLPSGHTTAAASVSAALLLVVPARARPWAAAAGAAYTTATGVSTLIGQWHRPSDVVAATLVVLGWMAITCALVALTPARLSGPATGAVDAAAVSRAAADDTRDAARRQRRGVMVVLVTLGVAAGAVAVLALGHTWAQDFSLARADLLVAYAGGAAGATAASCLTFAAMLALRTAVSDSAVPARAVPGRAAPGRLPRA
ncbi:phosphatase PAP2 family protein [Cellulomonas alba]|uniref:Phosphatase PAP2 family protein n=1 Tax=Cellulomonas alba TaxID=3053467 RepID=A0ABT7SGF9_9CELL|nr:phosphatase PAP2 family protein [Cellulomonas alba]MDM7855277.1 phosphatase PAP2 family protein [Cellulomonas alba]